MLAKHYSIHLLKLHLKIMAVNRFVSMRSSCVSSARVAASQLTRITICTRLEASGTDGKRAATQLQTQEKTLLSSTRYYVFDLRRLGFSGSLHQVLTITTNYGTRANQGEGCRWENSSKANIPNKRRTASRCSC